MCQILKIMKTTNKKIITQSKNSILQYKNIKNRLVMMKISEN
jgi:hypothetical protein